MANHFALIAYEERPSDYQQVENLTLDHDDLNLLTRTLLYIGVNITKGSGSFTVAERQRVRKLHAEIAQVMDSLRSQGERRG